MNFKEALRKDTNYLRGLGSLDAKLRNNWIKQNEARLRQARNVLTTDDYKMFAEDLYRLQLWNNLEAENISKGVYGKNFRPTVDYVKNYFNKKVSEIDNIIKYHPDVDDNNVYVGSKKNTGFSPEIWNIYNSLKDEQARKEFLAGVKTEDVLKREAEELSYINYVTQPNQVAVGVTGGDLSSENILSGFLIEELAPNMAKDSPNTREYYKDNAGLAETEKVINDNTEKARNIWSRSLERYRNSAEYQEKLNNEVNAISDRWNKEASSGNKQESDKKHEEEFLNAIKDNSVLAAASGYDPKTEEFSHEKFQQFESLLEEDPNFKANYIANKNVLAKQVQEGQISEDDYNQSLIDIANASLKDHESFITRARNAGKSALNTGVTYTLHKFAPFVNTAEALKKGTDGKIFMDNSGNIYQDTDIALNAKYIDPKNADKAVIYKTSNGVSINYNKDGDKIFTLGEDKYIYQNEDGTFATVDSNTIDPNDEHLRKVKEIEVINTPVGTHDLVRLGKDDSGKDLDWAGGIFNQKYLELSDRYNISPWNREELDYYNNFGYSNYVNIVRPGDDGRDFLGETIKMMGFVGADLLMAALTRGVGKAGSAVGAGMRTMRTLEMSSGLLGAVGIADSYAQSIFTENLARNQEALQQYISNSATKKAEDWINNEGKEEFNAQYNATLKKLEEQYGRELTNSEKAQLEMAVRNQVLSKKAMEYYNESNSSPEILQMQEKAVGDAGTASMVDFWGEGLKYGIVNTLGFRSWMFKGRSAAEQAARASEKTLFGRNFSRVGVATAEDVAANKAKQVGDVFLKEAWSTMSKARKAKVVLGTVGSQAWEGALTNWTDEMQSGGARMQNNSAFDSHLDNYNANGAYLFADAVASQLKGITESAFEENSLWAGLIGGAGSVMSFGFNPIGIVKLATKDGRSEWNNMSGGERFNSIFSNSVLSKVYERKANDRQAGYLLDRSNALLKSTSDNITTIINSLSSSSRIGHSESIVEAEENDVVSLFHTLQAIENFNRTNPGLAELDALQNIQRFAKEAEALADVEFMTEENKQDYIEQIKVNNPTMTEEQAAKELENVSSRANLMLDTIYKWKNLIESKEYKKAASKTEEKSAKQEAMEQQLILQVLNDYTLQNLKKREYEITGSEYMSSIVENRQIDQTTTEENPVATYGNKKTAIKNIKESYKIVQAKLEQRKSNMEKARENLNFEERSQELTQQIKEAPTNGEKEALQNQLEDLVRDYNYFNYEIARLENNIETNESEQARLTELFENTEVDSNSVISAFEIINLDPVSRLRMLDPNNFNNYSKKQQTQIKKAIAQLTEKGISKLDIENQAFALSRYQQRESMLEDLANGEITTPSFNTRVTNMISSANELIRANVKNHAKKTLKQLENELESNEEIINAKKAHLVRYSPATLRYIKDGLLKKDQVLVDEVLPIVGTGEQLVDLIYNEEYGLKGLTSEEKNNLHQVVATTSSNSKSVEELIQNLADYASNTINPSINTLLDKLAQVYDQQHSTIIESAKEKAERKRLDREAERERKNAEERAIQEAQETPAVGTSKESRKGEKQLNRGFENLQNATTPIEKANAISNIEHNVNHGAEISAEEKATLEQAKQELSEQGYEIVDMLGKSYSEGMKAIVDFVEDFNAPAGSQTITRIIKPQINKDGVMVQAAEIEVTMGPEKGSSLADVSNKSSNEIIQGAKETIMLTQEQVQPVAERDPHADHYLISGEKYMRVHGAMGDVWVGPNSPNKEANSARSLRNGSLVDGIVRDFFNDITPTKPEHFSEEAFQSLITSLESIKDKINKNGEEFLANNIVLHHKFPNGVKLAGEVDIISIKIVDGKPQYNIYDLKTSAGGRDGKAFNESPYWETNSEAGARNTIIGTREQYTNQLSSYKVLFERMFNTKVTNLALLPYKLSYSTENNVTGIEKYPGISLTYNPNIEKLIAYQPAITEALDKIQNTYEGLFTKEQLSVLKGIIANNIIKGESFGKDVAYFISNQGLEAQFTEIGKEKLNPIIKELKEAISNIDVAEVLKEEIKVSEPIPEAPTTPTPSELATVEPSNREYSPEKDSYPEPEIGSEFNALGENAGITRLSQSNQVFEESLDMTITTNELENTDISESSSNEIAATIKGNAMSPYVYEDKESGRDALHGILVEKKARESMQGFNNWMKARKINIQGLIDNKLSDILNTGTENNPVKVRFMRVNPTNTAVGNDVMKNHYLLVVEDSPAIRDVYTKEDIEKYGDFVKANGKEYLIIGTAGFVGNNKAQGNAYREIFTKGSNSVLSKSNSYFKKNTSEEFYVDPDKYTHVAKIHSGFITRQLVEDGFSSDRKVSELLNDSIRNPQGLTWDNLVFGYQTYTDFITVPSVSEYLYHSPAKAMQNVGNVFLYIKGADGRYTPTMLVPTRYAEIHEGSLKQKIYDALRQLSDLNHAERYKGLLALYDLVVLEQKDQNGIITGTDILIGTATNPSLTFKLNGKSIYSTNLRNANFKEIEDNFKKLNPRISVTGKKLLDISLIKELDEANALRTDIAILGKCAGDYSVYNINKDGTPIITDVATRHTSTEVTRGPAKKNWVDGMYYERLGDAWVNERGEIVTDQSLLDSITLNDLILNSNIDKSTLIGTTEYFIRDLNSDSPTIIARDLGTHRARIVEDASEISQVKETISKELEESAKLSREEAAEIELNPPTEIEATTSPIEAPNNSPTESVDLRNSVTDLLNMENSDRETNNTTESIKTTAPTHDINIVERKSLVESIDSGKNAIFAEKNALEILTDEVLSDKAIEEITTLWPETEDMTISQIVDFLNKKGKQTTSIKDVESWIDTLKC